MTRDSVIFFGSLLLAIASAVTLILFGIDRMVSEENDIRAIARIYKPGGCEFAKEIISTLPEYTVFKCADQYTVVHLGFKK